MIIHVVPEFKGREKDRIARAQKSWRWNTLRVEGGRMEDDADPPFVGDLFQVAYDRRGSDSDLLVLTNNDVGLVSDIVDRLEENGPVFASNRVDFSGRIRVALHSRDLVGRKIYPGLDLVAIRASHWEQVKAWYPRMYVGNEGWDGIFRLMVPIISPVLWHERHESFWIDNRQTRWAIFNRRSAYLWAINSGQWAKFASEWPRLLDFAREFDSGNPI